MAGFIPELLIIAAMLAFNAVFAAFEMALASVSKARLAELNDKRTPGAAAALFMKNKLEASLSVIQLGITLFAAIAAAVGGAGINETFTPLIADTFAIGPGAADILALTLFVLPLSAVTIMFGELVPKVFAIENKELVLLRVSPVMRVLYTIAYPVVRGMEKITKTAVRLASTLLPSSGPREEKASVQEMRMAAAQALEQKLIGPVEERIVSSAAGLSLKKVGDLLIPPPAISHIPITFTLADALLRAHMDLHTRFPVTAAEGEPENIKGYVNFKDIVMALKMGSQSGTVASITRPIEKFPCGMTASRALETMTDGNIHMAVITENGGRILGLLTLEDIIRQLTGTIEDEYDRLPAHLYPSGDGLIAGGAARMKNVFRRLHLPTPPGNDILAFWVESKLGRPPAGSELLKLDGLTILVRKTRRHKLLEAYISKES
ncbi:MAG: hemolysin family protein [Elusimicrobiales bacterium]|nr:hemolysin family protein [Elusimicrobiales bacterium]